MTSATYEFKLDTQRDGNYANAYIDDLSDYLIGSMDWQTGFDTPYGAKTNSVAPPCNLMVRLRNTNGEFTNESFGAERVLNGNFSSWTSDDPNNWTVTGESGSDPAVQQVNPVTTHGGGGSGACNIYCSSSAATVSISQNILTIGKTYKVTLDVTARGVQAGGIQIMSGTTRVAPPINAIGTYTFYFNATASTLVIQNWYSANTTIDNVSCVECNGLYTYLLRMGTLGRLRVTYNGTTYTKFIGRLIKKTAAVGEFSSRVIALEFTDPMADMLYGSYQPELTQNVTIDEAIQPVFDSAVIAFPYSHAYWMVGIQGCSELGTSTYLFSPAATDFDTCYTTLDFVGDISDTAGVGINPNMFIQQQMAAEAGGRFFYNPETGTFDIHSRNRDTLNLTVAGSFDENSYLADKSVVSSGEDLENHCSISFMPREVGSTTDVIWSASNLPVTIPVGATYKTTARFQDQSVGNNRIGAKDVIKPVAGTDYVLQAFSVPYYRVAVSVKINANTAEWEFSNVRGNRGVNITTLQLRGTKITFYDPKTVTSINGDSIRDNVLSQNTLSIPAISDEDFAQNYADYRVNKFGTPTTHFDRIGFYANDNDQQMTNALALVIGDRITVTESWSGHDEDYFIVGMTHSVLMGGENQHLTTFFLKPAGHEQFWLLGQTGFSELGTTTRIAF